MRFLLVICLAGCITDPSPETDPAVDARAQGRMDLSSPDGDPADVGMPDAKPALDLSPDERDADAPVADAALPILDAAPIPDAVPTPDCADACARVSGCGQADPNCLERCNAADDPSPWISCVMTASCDGIDACPSPVLSCAAVCEMVGDCGIECAAMCAAGNIAPTAACGQAETCNQAVACLFGDDCADRWRRASMCGAERADIALRACANPESMDYGALVARRHAVCFTEAEECPAVDRCLAPPAPNENTANDHCDAVRACGLDDTDCNVAYNFHRRSGDAFCVYENVVLRCRERRPRQGEECSLAGLTADLNQAATACGLGLAIPADEPESRWIRRLGCIRAVDCQELGRCLASTRPATACATRCQSLVACGLSPDQATCVDTCSRRFDWVRDPIEAKCIAAAADCDETARCTVGNSALCDLACARAEACGVRDTQECAASCSFLGFAFPHVSYENACYLGAPSCDEISGCPRAYTGCLHACRLQGECAGRPPDDGRWLAECIINCDDADVPACLAQHTGASCEDLARCP